MIYNVTFRGAPSPTLRAAFDDCQVVAGEGVTTLRTSSVDRAGFHGLLNRLDAFGLDVLEVKLVQEAGTAGQSE